MRLIPVASANVSGVWPLVAHFVDRACERAVEHCDAGELRANCERGANQLWVVMDDVTPKGIFITGLSDGVCHWLVVSGEDRSAWHHLAGHVEQWAKEQGCKAMRSIGRRGWKTKVPDYRVKGFIFEKAL